MVKQRACADFDRILIAATGSSKDTVPPEAQAHLAECEQCRALVQALDHQEEFHLPDDVINRLQRPILKTLKPVRPLPPSWVFLTVFMVIFLAIAAFGMLLVDDLGWEALAAFQRTVVFTSLAASATLLAFSTVRQMQPGSRNFFSPALLPIAVFLLLSLAVASIFGYGNNPDFVRNGMACFKAGISFALPSGLLFWWILSRGVVLHRYVAGATAGMLAGLIGTSVLEVKCPILDMAHIIVWHLGVAVAGSFAGLIAAYLGGIISRWREPAP